jgi:DNA-binding response OmpR family regulator
VDVTRARPAVLLVEDDEKFARLLGRALARIHLRPRYAATGDSALRAIRTDSSVRAVILDVMIPHPDGIEVCRQIRRDGWTGPVIVISARGSAADRARARAAGADGFLAKPLRMSELLDFVSALLDGKPLQGAAGW